MLIDTLAYKSALRNIDPMVKSLFALVCVFICVWANSFVISGAVLAVMLFLIIAVGKTRARDAFGLMTVPAMFVILGSAAVAVSVGASPDNMRVFIRLGGLYIGIGDITLALRVAAKCFSSVSCMYFLSLTTPMTELFALLQKSIIPGFIVEIMELIYRYIFVLFDASARIHTAQEARLGYATLKSNYRSTAYLAANIFNRAYRQADRTYTAMEARLYSGDIVTLNREYPRRPLYYITAAGAAAVLLTAAFVCRRLGI